MRILTTFFLFASLLLFETLQAQVIRNQSQPTQASFLSFQAQQQRFGQRNSSLNARNTYEAIGEFDGSPYVFAEAVPATIVAKDGERFRVRFFSVDVYTNEYVVSEEKVLSMDTYIWLQKSELDRVEVEVKSDESTYLRIFKEINAGIGEDKLGICEILYQNEERGIQIIKKYEATYIRGRKGTNVIADVPPKFRSTSEVYSLTKSNGLQHLKKAKDFHKLFDSNEKEVKSFMKRERLAFDESIDIAKVFAQFNL